MSVFDRYSTAELLDMAMSMDPNGSNVREIDRIIEKREDFAL